MPPKKPSKRPRKARRVDVHCAVSDPADGPDMLGFVFFVSAEERPADLKRFITQTCAKHGIPLDGGIVVGRPAAAPKKVWTRRMIENCIERNGPAFQ